MRVFLSVTPIAPPRRGGLTGEVLGGAVDGPVLQRHGRGLTETRYGRGRGLRSATTHCCCCRGPGHTAAAAAAAVADPATLLLLPEEGSVPPIYEPSAVRQPARRRRCSPVTPRSVGFSYPPWRGRPARSSRAGLPDLTDSALCQRGPCRNNNSGGTGGVF